MDGMAGNVLSAKNAALADVRAIRGQILDLN
jgi:hypothetical protein